MPTLNAYFSRYNENVDISNEFHGVHIQTVRQFARRNFGLSDSEDSASRCRRDYNNDAYDESKWLKLPIDESCAERRKRTNSCDRYHSLGPEIVLPFCMGELGMTLPGLESVDGVIRVEKEVRVEVPVEVIREVIVEKPVPLALTLTFDQLAALRFGLHEAQVLLNDDIRVAMLGDDAEKALRLADRMERFHEVLAILGIEPVPDLSVVPPRGGMTEPIDAMAAQMLLLPRG